jgi:hypothetical protein
MNRSEYPPIEVKLSSILSNLISARYPEILQLFGAQFLAGLEVSGDSENFNLVANSVDEMKF